MKLSGIKGRGLLFHNDSIMKKLTTIFLSVILCSSLFGQYDWIVGDWAADVQGQSIAANFDSDGSLTMRFGSGQAMSETYKVTSGSTIVLTSGKLPYEISEDRNRLDLDLDGNIVNFTRQEVTASSKPKSKASSNLDCDRVLADYEASTDKYIKLLKKYNEGDMSVKTDYLAMMEKTVTLQESLVEVEDDMTVAQLQKYIKTSQKMINSASELK